MRLVLLTFVLSSLSLALVFLWMAGGVQRPKVRFPLPVLLPDVPAAEDADADSLTVVTWNIAWGYGRGSEGVGTARPAERFDETLARMGEVLRRLNPDVVLLQEVDFDSARSHHRDQAEALARAAGLPYVAKAVSWEAGYVPFPYWPPEDHFGAMLSGGAILSRYPIESHSVETVDKPAVNPWWYNLFYLFRYHQQAFLQTPLGKVMVMNIHAEAFDREARVAHARRIAEVLSDSLLPESVVGGDLNTVLPEATVKSGYPDEPETSHVDDPTLGFLRSVNGLVDTVQGDAYVEQESTFFTFPSDAPNRKLDYLLCGAGLDAERVWVPRELADELSDHLPVVARFRAVGRPTRGR